MEITQDLLTNKQVTYNYTEETKYRTGIYKVTIANHFYIGSASSKRGFYIRWHKHISELKHHVHKNPKFQNCYDKYDQIIFDIVEFCDPVDCIKREQYYIDTLKPDINIHIIACNTALGTKQTPEVIEKRRKKLLGRKYNQAHRKAISDGLKCSWKDPNSKMRSKEAQEKRRNSHLGKKVLSQTLEKYRIRMIGNTYNNKVVYQYSKDRKTFIKEWESAKIAAQTLKIGYAHISSCCTGKRKSAYGFYWTHEKITNGNN